MFGHTQLKEVENGSQAINFPGGSSLHPPVRWDRARPPEGTPFGGTRPGSSLLPPEAEPAHAPKAFRVMRTLWIEAGKMPWCRARFNLFSSGKFEPQLSYADSDENAQRVRDVSASQSHDGATVEGHRIEPFENPRSAEVSPQ